MGDISREPLPSGPRKGRSTAGGQESIRFEELHGDAPDAELRMTRAEDVEDGPRETEPREPGPTEGGASRLHRATDLSAFDPELPLEAMLARGEPAEAVDTADADGPSEAELAADLALDEPVAEPGSEDENAIAAPVSTAIHLPESAEVSDEARPLSDPAEIARVAMAILLCAREPLPLARLVDALCCSTAEARAGLDALARELRERGLPLELVAIDDSWRLSTLPAVHPYLLRLRKLKKAERLSPAALETLAVIAYRQPVIRAEIEAIRGVKAGPVLKNLLDHKLVRAVGRADVPGRPLMYGTTQHFLDRFGLRSIEDLPSVSELRALGS
jgi:segregation and condensation protein B